jgi:hypothetical protein
MFSDPIVGDDLGICASIKGARLLSTWLMKMKIYTKPKELGGDRRVCLGSLLCNCLY